MTTIFTSSTTTCRRLVLSAVLMFLSAIFSFGQEKSISGTVLDENGSGLPGVAIQVKGTNVGVITDLNGGFTLSAKSDDILVISFVGYLSQEVSVGAQTNLSISLSPDITELTEVVVVGYGTQKKSQLTGSLASISSKDFEDQPLNNVSQALQGRAAGVQVTQTSGTPGGDFKIRIRGANSITGSNEPLYVVDGQFVDISTVNINDIQSIEVLKDASATAIYGTRGANGVILITTKRGTKGKVNINTDLFTGVSNVVQKLDMMTAAQFAEGVNFSEGSTVFTAEEIAELEQTGGEDWQELLFQQGFSRNAQISASGGSGNTDYYVSGNYFDEVGAVIDQRFTRVNLRTNLNTTLSEKIKMGLNFNIGRVEQTGVKADLGAGLAWDPTTMAFNENGEYNFNSTKNLATSQPNPLVAVENNSRRNINDRLSINGNLNYDITPTLLFNTAIGINRTDIHNNSYAPIITNNRGIADVDNIYSTNYFNTNRLTYSNIFDSKHDLKVDLIHELVLDRANRLEVNAQDFFTDVVTYKDLSAANIQIVSNSESNRDLESFLGRVNYSLMEKYLLTASFRADGTSVFQNNKWGYFPSASAAWVVSKENFFSNIEFVNNLKIRTSYGQIGNQGIGVFGTRSRALLSAGVNYPFSGPLVTGTAPSNRVPNPDLTWEKTEQINLGFDVSIVKSAVVLSVDYYKKNTTDLLLDTQLPEYVGPTRKFVNAGEVENKGLEITLNTYILENDDWNISAALIFSRNRNKVLSLNDDVQFLEVGSEIRENTFPVKPTRVEVGLPISSFRGYVFEGVYQIGEEAEAAVFGKAPGDAKYKDLNGDDVISTDDITVIGDGNPDFTWGWNWSVGYKSWDLNFLLTGSHGNQIYNLQKARLMALGAQQFHAVHADYNNRWTPDNPSNVPSGRDGTEILSSQFIEDGSYITMKNISLNYNINREFLERIGLVGARVYASSQNLFIFTDYSGFDPESNASVNNEDADVGIDYNTYPLNRSFLFGLNITF